MTGLTGIHHVGIVVQDLEASTEWYVDKLGFERLYTFGFPGFKAAFVGRDNLRLELFQNEQATPMAGERQVAETNLRIGGINHFAIGVTDLDGTVAALKERA